MAFCRLLPAGLSPAALTPVRLTHFGAQILDADHPRKGVNPDLENPGKFKRFSSISPAAMANSESGIIRSYVRQCHC